jgi:hypothetical protein
MKVQISCFWSLTRPELAGASVSFPRFLIWKRKFVFNIFRWGLWAPPLFFIGLKNVFFCGVSREHWHIYRSKGEKFTFSEKDFIFYIFLQLCTGLNALNIVFEILLSFTPLAHSFWSVIFTGLAQNVCPFWEGPFAQQFFTYISWGS